MADQKSVSLARQLKEDLALRQTLAVVDAFDTDGAPLLKIGTQTAGSQAALIKVKEIASIQTDGLGLAQRSFGPHVIQVVVEMSATTNVAILTLPVLLAILGEVTKQGAKVELYMSANTTPIATTEITAANLVAKFDSLWFPLTSSM